MSNRTIKDLVVNALETDGAHHKQWYLERILEALGFDLKTVKAEENEHDYDWEEGIAP